MSETTVQENKGTEAKSTAAPLLLFSPAIWLGLTVAAYLTIGVLYAFRTPAWQVPDEPAHYNYVRHLVEQRAFPVLQPGDYDQGYLSKLTGEGFPPSLPIDAVRYEGHQPPLYYLLAAPVFSATDGNLVSLRLFSLVLGGGVILFTYFLVLEVFPGATVLALTAAGFVAFVPQHVAMMAGVNNDSLAELLMAYGLWRILRLLKASPAGFGVWDLGFTLGLAFITKTTAYPLAAIAGVMLLLKARRESWNKRQLVTALLMTFLPALLLGALWWGRNLAVYGGVDILGLQRHNAIVVGQARTVEWLAQYGWAGYTRQFITTTFQSFWGQFGWMGVVMDQRVYLALLAYSLLIVIGFVGAADRRRRARDLTREQGDAIALLTITLLLAIALYLYYNLTFVQFQGRYLFPALPVIALGSAIGLRQWAAWFTAILNTPYATRHTPYASLPALRALPSPLPLLPIALTAFLDLFALYRFIVPALVR